MTTSTKKRKVSEPPTATMDSNVSESCNDGKYSCGRNFGFAFEDPDFSDRTLRLEIDKENGDETLQTSKSSSWSQLDSVGGEIEPVARIDESHSGDEVLQSNKSEGRTPNENEYAEKTEELHSGTEALQSNKSLPLGMDCSKNVIVKHIPISYLIVAERSPYFRKIFSNGATESNPKVGTLRINASEENALMELLGFMYKNTVSATTAPALLDILNAAVKYEVVSCMKHCCHVLCNLPITDDLALVYLGTPNSLMVKGTSNSLRAEAVQSLNDAAKKHFVEHYKDITKVNYETLLNLPLAAIEAIFSSDDLQVRSEDDVYDFLLKWAGYKYANLEKKREVLGTHLSQLIRFPFMSCVKLQEFLSCDEFDGAAASKIVLDSFFFKVEPQQRKHSLAANKSTSMNRQLVEREYLYHPVRVVYFDLPLKQTVVYLNLKRGECAKLNPSGQIRSHSFLLGGHIFFLLADHCKTMEGKEWFILRMKERESVDGFSIKYEAAARSKQTRDFKIRTGNYTFPGEEQAIGCCMLAISWRSLIDNDSAYFINDILCLRTELTIEHY